MWGIIAGVVSYPVFYFYSQKPMDYLGLDSGIVRALFVVIMSVMLASAFGYGVGWAIDTPKERAQNNHFILASTHLITEAASCVDNSKGKPCITFTGEESKWSDNLLYGVNN